MRVVATSFKTWQNAWNTPVPVAPPFVPLSLAGKVGVERLNG